MATICKISAALDAEVVKVADYELEQPNRQSELSKE
jgi:hypothetical protein